MLGTEWSWPDSRDTFEEQFSGGVLSELLPSETVSTRASQLSEVPNVEIKQDFLSISSIAILQANHPEMLADNRSQSQLCSFRLEVFASLLKTPSTYSMLSTTSGKSKPGTKRKLQKSEFVCRPVLGCRRNRNKAIKFLRNLKLKRSRSLPPP